MSFPSQGFNVVFVAYTQKNEYVDDGTTKQTIGKNLICTDKTQV